MVDSLHVNFTSGGRLHKQFHFDIFNPEANRKKNQRQKVKKQATSVNYMENPKGKMSNDIIIVLKSNNLTFLLGKPLTLEKFLMHAFRKITNTDDFYFDRLVSQCFL